MRNPLTQFELPKYPGVEQVLTAGLHRPVVEVREALHNMGCHVSCQELESWRQPRRRKGFMQGSELCQLVDKEESVGDGATATVAGGCSSAATSEPSDESRSVWQMGKEWLTGLAHWSWKQNGTQPPLAEGPPPSLPPSPPESDNEDEQLGAAVDWTDSQQEHLAVALTEEAMGNEAKFDVLLAANRQWLEEGNQEAHELELLQHRRQSKRQLTDGVWASGEDVIELESSDDDGYNHASSLQQQRHDSKRQLANGVCGRAGKRS
jgi:hypothetical protein